MQGRRIQFRHLHVKLAPDQEVSIGQNRGWRIADVIPAGRWRQRRPGVLCRIVNRAQVGEGELAKVVFAAFDQDAAVGQHLRGHGIGLISGSQTGNLRPGAVHVTSVDVGREFVPVVSDIALDHDRSIGQQKRNSGPVRRLILEGCQCLRQRDVADSQQKCDYGKEQLLRQNRPPSERHNKHQNAKLSAGLAFEWGIQRSARLSTRKSLSRATTRRRKTKFQDSASAPHLMSIGLRSIQCEESTACGEKGKCILNSHGSTAQTSRDWFLAILPSKSHGTSWELSDTARGI